MQFSVEKVDEFKRNVKTEMTAEEVAPFIENAYKNVASKARIDGFRKGKAPKRIILMQYGSAISAEASDAIFQKNYKSQIDALGNESDFFGTPSIVDMGKLEEGKGLTYVTEFIVVPEFELKPIEQISVEKPVCVVTDELVNESLERVRKEHSAWQVVDGLEVADNTRADINFLGKVDGEPFEGGQADNFMLEVSESRMIPGFTESIKGHKAGDEFVINVTFPEDYYAENLKGKAATFDIKVNTVAERKMLTDEELLKELDMADESIDTLKNNMRVNMTRTLEHSLRNMSSEALIKALSDAQGKFAVPEAAIEEQRERIARNRISGLLRSFGSMSNIDAKLVASLVQNAKDKVSDEEAADSVRSEVVFGRYIKAFKLTEEAAQKSEELLKADAPMYGGDNVEEFMSYLNKNPDTKRSLLTSVSENYVVNELLKKTQVTEKPVSFEEATASQNMMF